MEGSGLASTYERGRPEVDEAAAGRLLAHLFGVAGTLSELGSQQDRNYLVSGGDGRHVLKIFHAATPPGLVEDQLAAMRLLAGAGIPAPQPVPGLDGAHRQHWTAADGAAHTVVLLTFVEGTQLVGVPRLSRRVARALARLAGRVSAALGGVRGVHPRDSQWDLRVPLQVVRELAGSVPEDRRGVVLDVAEVAWSAVERVADGLPTQVVHGDITDDNVVAVPAADGVLEPVGVIDFGDLATSWRIGELAVLLASMLHHEFAGLDVLADMVDAFDAETGLTEAEVRAAWPLVQLRCAVLVVSGWQQLAIDPGNDYAAERMDHEWACFERARTLPVPVMTNLFLARRTPPAPVTSPQLVAPRGATPQVLPLGPASEDHDDGRWLVEHAEAHVLRARTAGTATVQAIPQGEYRLSRSRPALDAAAQEPFSLVAEFVSGQAFTVEATAVLDVAGTRTDGVDLRTGDGRLLVLGGLAPAPGVVPGDRLHRGEAIGTAVADAEGACHRVRVQLVEGDAALPAFCRADLAPGYSPLVGGTNSAIGLPEPDPVAPAVASAAEQARRNRFLPDNTERYYAEPPTIVRGWGAYLVDTESRAYLDLVNNVAAVGHSHPAVRRAVSRSLGLLNTNSRFLYRSLADFSERLLATTGDGGYDSVLLVNSGTEAVDLALRIARLATGRSQVIAHREGYHGWSLAADAITTSAYDNPSALHTRPSWVSLAEAPNPYRGRHRGPDAGPSYLRDAGRLVDGLVADGTPPAAVVMESTLGNAGGVVPPPGYFAGVIDLVHRAGGLGIADEVQVGYGRTGTSFWAFQAEGARPDIIVCAKAMGNGFPLGAVITRREISSVLGREGLFFSTTGGSPAACAAGLAVLDVIEGEGLMARAREVGSYLAGQVAELARRHPLIGAVHGRGFYQGVELVSDPELLTPAAVEAALLCESLLTRGVIDQVTSERQNVLKVKPPMTLTRADVDHYVAALDDVLSRGWM